MDKSPANRYATCAEFATDLGKAIGMVAGSPSVAGGALPAAGGGDQPVLHPATQLAAGPVTSPDAPAPAPGTNQAIPRAAAAAGGLGAVGAAAAVGAVAAGAAGARAASGNRAAPAVAGPGDPVRGPDSPAAAGAAGPDPASAEPAAAGLAGRAGRLPAVPARAAAALSDGPDTAVPDRPDAAGHRLPAAVPGPAARTDRPGWLAAAAAATAAAEVARRPDRCGGRDRRGCPGGGRRRVLRRA